LEKSLTFHLELFPSNYEPDTYLNTLNVTDMAVNGRLPEDFTPSTLAGRIPAVLEAYHAQENAPARVAFGSTKLFATTRRLIYTDTAEYRPQGRSGGGGYQTETIQVLFYPDPQDTNRVAWSFLDEDNFEYTKEDMLA